jgi:hypothetical protein
MRGVCRRALRLGLLVSLLAAMPARAEQVTNATVVEMHQMGLGAPILVQAIESSSCRFDTGLDALRQLKAAGIPDDVIAAMMRVTTVQASADVDPSDPNAPHAAGIYVMADGPDGPRLTRVEPSVYTQAKAGMLAMVFSHGLAKAKLRAVLRASSARLQLESEQPVFYFYFEESNAGLSYANSAYAATSPNEFVLVQARVKDGSREVQVGSFNAFSSAEGVADKLVRDFDYEMLGQGIYRVTPRAPLAPGEYCFVHGSGGGTGAADKVWDFGVTRRSRAVPDSADRPVASPSVDVATSVTPAPETTASVGDAGQVEELAETEASDAEDVLPVAVEAQRDTWRLSRMRDDVVIEVGCQGRSWPGPIDASSVRLVTANGLPFSAGGLAPIGIDRRPGTCVAMTFDGKDIGERLARMNLSRVPRLRLGLDCLLADGRPAHGSAEVGVR